jgi:hypothetical protein
MKRRIGTLIGGVVPLQSLYCTGHGADTAKTLIGFYLVAVRSI